MTDNEKLFEKVDQARLEIVKLSGKLDALTLLLSQNDGRIKQLEGRLWGLLIFACGSFGTALLSLVMKAT